MGAKPFILRTSDEDAKFSRELAKLEDRLNSCYIKTLI